MYTSIRASLYQSVNLNAHPFQNHHRIIQFRRPGYDRYMNGLLSGLSATPTSTSADGPARAGEAPNTAGGAPNIKLRI